MNVHKRCQKNAANSCGINTKQMAEILSTMGLLPNRPKVFINLKICVIYILYIYVAVTGIKLLYRRMLIMCTLSLCFNVVIIVNLLYSLCSLQKINYIRGFLFWKSCKYRDQCNKLKSWTIRVQAQFDQQIEEYQAGFRKIKIFSGTCPQL